MQSPLNEPSDGANSSNISPENDFAQSTQETIEVKLRELLSHRFEACELLRLRAEAELGYVPAPLQKAMARLKNCEPPDELLKREEIIVFAPLLGEISRNDLPRIQTTLTGLINEANSKRRFFRMTYGKSIFILAVLVNLLIHYYVLPKITVLEESTYLDSLSRLPAENRVGIHNILGQNIYLSIVSIVVILTLWEFIVYFRDRIILYLSQVPFWGGFLSGTRRRLQETSKFAYIAAELIDTGMPWQQAVQCDGIRRMSIANFSNSIIDAFHAPLLNPNQSSKLTAHLRQLGDIYSYNNLIRHKTSELYAASSTLVVGLLVYITCQTLLNPLVNAIRMLGSL